MEALGRLVDISPGIQPLDLATARTGIRFHMKGVGGLTIVVFKGIGTAGDDQTWTLEQHTASSGGTTAVIPLYHYYLKTAVTPGLTGADTWTKYTQTAAEAALGTIVAGPGTATSGGAGHVSAEANELFVIEVNADSLDDGYEWVSLSNDGAGANAQLGAVLYLAHELDYQRAPANLPDRLT